MRTAFVLLYALAGTLLLFIDLSWTVAASIDARLYVGLTALLFLFAARQGWFHGGGAWRAVHVTFGVVSIALCLSLWVMGFLLLQDKYQWLPPVLPLLAAGILTVPAVAYLASLIAWARSAKTDRPAAVLRPNAPNAAPVQVPDAGLGSRRLAGRRFVGLTFALLALGALVVWARFGGEWRCTASDPRSCYSATEEAVRRGDLAKALALYEGAIPAELAKQLPLSEQLPRAWRARNEILVRLDDRAHLAEAIVEVCPQLVTTCQDLVKTFTRAKDLSLAEEAWRALCRSGSEDACGDYGQWLVELKGTEPGLAALSSYCASASVEACRRLGIQLKAAGRPDKAREPLLRSCPLSLAAKRSGRPPRLAICQSVIRLERSTVSNEQLLEDIRSVCAEDMSECPSVSMDLDRPTYRKINEEACRVHGLNAQTGYPYCPEAKEE